MQAKRASVEYFLVGGDAAAEGRRRVGCWGGAVEAKRGMGWWRGWGGDGGSRPCSGLGQRLPWTQMSSALPRLDPGLSLTQASPLLLHP